MRWAPVVYGAVDLLHKADAEAEQRAQRTRDLASQRSGPRFSGGMG